LSIIVQGTSGFPEGGGTMSVLINPGNLEIAAECLACHVVKACSDPAWILAVDMSTAGLFIRHKG
jgi:hypothetical protein